MNSLVNEHPGVDGRAADTIFVGELPVGESLRQIFTDGLFFNVHKFTFLCKPISGRDITAAEDNLVKPVFWQTQCNVPYFFSVTMESNCILLTNY